MNDNHSREQFPEPGSERGGLVGTVVRSLPGVSSVRVTRTEDGSLESVRVVVSGDVPAYRLVPAIRSAVLVYLDLQLDEEQISVCEAHDRERPNPTYGQNEADGGAHRFVRRSTSPHLDVSGEDRSILTLASPGPNDESLASSGSQVPPPNQSDSERHPRIDHTTKPDRNEEGSPPERVEPDDRSRSDTSEEETGRVISAGSDEASRQTEVSAQGSATTRAKDSEGEWADADASGPGEGDRVEPPEYEESLAVGRPGSVTRDERPPERGTRDPILLLGYVIEAEPGDALQVRMKVQCGSEEFVGTVPVEGGFESISPELFAEAATEAAKTALRLARGVASAGRLRLRVDSVDEVQVHYQGYLAVSVSARCHSGERSVIAGFAAISDDPHRAAALAALDAIRRILDGESAS